MTDEDRKALALRLDALVVFRGLLEDPALAALRRYLRLAGREASRDELVGAYAELVYRLLEAGDGSLAAHVRRIACDDENALTRAYVAGKVPYDLWAMVTSELGTLQLVADLTPRDLVGEEHWEDWLPSFGKEHIDVADAYRSRIDNAGRVGFGIYAHHRMFYLGDDGAIVPVAHPDPMRLSDLVDYERERGIVLDNTRALLEGRPAANVLLSGDAGTGKSSTVKAIVNELAGEGLRIIEVRKDQLRLIPGVLDELSANPLKFILFIDDLSFSANDPNYAALKAVLEGSVAAKSANVVVYATSNRRHIVRETFSDREGDEVHLNDTLQEMTSLSERFGIHVTFSRPDKVTYLDIVHKLADDAGVDYDPADLDRVAERYALRRGGRSARGARQFVDALLAGSQTVAPRKKG